MNMKWMKRFFVGIFLLASLTAVTMAADMEMKVGVVVWRQLLDEAPQVKAAMKRLETEFAPRRNEIVAKEQEFQQLSEKLVRDQDVMSETQRRQAEQVLRDKERELSRSQREYLEDLNLKRNEEMSDLNRQLLEEVQAYARNANYDLVIGDGVLFASDTINITEQVLSGLQERYQQN